MQQLSLNQYTDFVNGVTSEPTNNPDAFIQRFNDLRDAGFNPSLLLNSGIGLSSEGGEFNEIVKKVFFQGKEFNEDLRFHLKRELGDIIFYWTNACRSLGLDPNEVISENVSKLESRYPGGFTVQNSEVRKAGDL